MELKAHEEGRRGFLRSVLMRQQKGRTQNVRIMEVERKGE